MIKISRLSQIIGKRFCLSLPGFCHTIFGHFHAEIVSEFLNRFRETQAFELHQKGNRRSMLAAPEAFKELLAGIDCERRRFFFVKRAACHPVAALVLQLHIAADHLHDVGARQNLFNKALRNH